MRVQSLTVPLLVLAVLGCSASAQSQPAPQPAPGALRARTVDGSDLGLVYHVERMLLPNGQGGTIWLPTAVLKAPGAVPFLEWRVVRSGEAYPCPSVHELTGCAGAAALPDLNSGFACAGADGQAYQVNAGATPAEFAFQSSRSVTFDGATFVVTCVDGAGTLPRALPLVQVGPSRTIASRLALLAAD